MSEGVVFMNLKGSFAEHVMPNSDLFLGGQWGLLDVPFYPVWKAPPDSFTKKGRLGKHTA